MNKIEKENVEQVLALTPMQEGLLFHYLKDPGGEFYFEQLSMKLSGEIDRACFERAWQCVVDENEMLRTLFRWGKISKPTQVVLKQHNLEKKYYDFSNQAAAKKARLVKGIETIDKEKKFDLSSVPFRVTLCQLGAKQYEMIISSHHILYDGWSNGIILEEFFRAYHALSRGEQLQKPVKAKFGEFIKWLQTNDTDKQETYWKHHLQGFDTPTKLPMKSKEEKEKAANEAGDYAFRTRRIRWEDDLKTALARVSSQLKITAAAILYSAWGLLLQRYNNSDDVLFGTTVSGRNVNIRGIEEMVGLFINTVPLRLQSRSHETAADLLHRVDRQLKKRQEVEHTPLVKIKEYSEIETTAELFDTIVVIENWPLSARLKTGADQLRVDSYKMNENTHYDLTVAIGLFNEIELTFTYHTGTFAEDAVDRLADHFREIVKEIIAHPGKEASSIEMITEEEKRQLLYDFNDTRTGFPRQKTIHQLFAEQAERTADGVALLAAGSQDTRFGQSLLSITYHELDRLSDRLARLLLIEKSVKPDTVVGIMMERSIEMVTAVLGILKAGGAYVPIGPQFPEERIKYMLEDSGTAILLTTRDLGDRFQGRDRFETYPYIELIEDRRGESMYSPDSHTPSRLRRATPLKRGIPGIPSPGGVPEGRGGLASDASLAYIIYTSGSTGKPKGVLITHRNICPLLHWGYHDFKLSPDDRTLQNLSYFFDWSAWEIFITLTSGAGLYIPHPDVIINPAATIDFITVHAVTVLHITPTQFQYLLNVEGDLKTLDYLFIGAEKLTSHMVQQGCGKVRDDCRVFNMYGPTEATIISATLEIQRDEEISYEGLSSVPIGTPSANANLFILDRYMNWCPLNVAGELYIAGEGVAPGYLNRPELTDEKFITAPAHSNQPQPVSNAPNIPLFQHSIIPGAGRPRGVAPTVPEGPMRLYKTGDLARWLPDGNVEFLGRIDHQVKIRGFRIELGEIENQLLEHAGVEEAVVIDRQDERGESHLCAYIVRQAVRQQGNKAIRKEGGADLREFLSRTLPDYMIPSYFIEMDKLPMTPSGKLDRKSLPVQKVAETAAGYTAPSNERERKLVEIWSGILGIEKEKIGIDASFFEIGGHSLKAVQLVSRVHKDFDVLVPLSEMFKIATIRALSGYIEAAVAERFLSIAPVAKKEYYPLTSAQKRFFIFQELEAYDVSYNMHEMVVMEGRLERKRFQETFKSLIRRHESLRTSFRLVDGEAMQQIHQEIEFEIEYYHLEPTAVADWFEVDDEQGGDEESWDITPRLPQPLKDTYCTFIRPFDLSHAPLMRAGLITLEEEKHILMVDMHHIIADGTSIGLFIRDFLSLYKGEELPMLRIQYKDYAQWLNNRSKGVESGKRREGLYPEDFEDELLDLPTDWVRSPEQSFEGNIFGFAVGKEETDALNDLAMKEDATLFMVILAAFDIFLSRLCGKENIVVGSPIAGRIHNDVEDVIGLFINTLVIRNFPSGEKKCSEFLEEVKEKSLQAFENQEYQYEELLERIETAKASGRNPLFDVMFVLQNMDLPEIEMPGLKVVRRVRVNWTSKFDMTLYCEEKGGRLLFVLEYCTKLFKQETIWRYARYLKRVIAEISHNPRQKISEIEMISREEKREILYEFNDIEVEYPGDKTINRLFEEQAEKRPNNTALVGRGGRSSPGEMRHCVSLTYLELNNEADKLSGQLIDRGLKPGDIAAIIAERSVELIAAVMAILKAGGAYLPIDPGYPAERKKYILRDSSAGVVLTTRDLAEEFEELRGCESEMIFIEEQARNLAHQSANRQRGVSTANDPAYIIYTSGSTGKPKGVLVGHRSAVNILTALQREYPLLESDTYLFKTSYGFDVSVAELFGWYFEGGKLAILEKGGEKEPEKIIAAIEKEAVTHINFVPSMFNVFVDEIDSQNIARISSLKYIFLAGEALLPEPVNKFREFANCIKLENIYGPTEGTIYSSQYSLSHWPGKGNIPIGKPMQNIRLYILDGANHLQPIGIAGELTISGSGLSRGYLNRPALTAEKFVTAPPFTLPPQPEVPPGTSTPNIPLFQHSIIPGTNKDLKLITENCKLYKTGDLARWRPDGNIEFLGRIDHQVKIRGFRVELGEIKNQLLKHGDIREAVVVAKESSLCAYITVQGASCTPGNLREYLRQSLPDYMIPSYFVPLEKIPLTASGKIDRKALPEPEIKVSLQEFTPPRNELDERLADIWSDVLVIKRGKISIDASFLELGGHSLKAALLTSRIHKELAVRVPMLEIFKRGTIRRLSEFIRSSEKEICSAIEPTEEKEYYTLSSAQKRMYLLHQMQSESTHYNIPDVVVLAGEVEESHLQETFRQLIARHESLRTSFALLEGEPVQRIHSGEDVDFEIEYYIGTRHQAEGSKGQEIPSPEGMPEGRGGFEPETTIIESFIRPFDLSRAPLLRVGLIKIEEEKQILMLDMHHIISDGTSIDLLVHDFVSLYSGENLPLLKIQYKDFSEWQNNTPQREAIKTQQAYWLKEFEQVAPVLDLPTDYLRPLVQSFEGNTLRFEIDKKQNSALKMLARDEDATLFMVLLSLYAIFLAKLSGQEDIVVGTPTAGRRHSEVEKIVGMFVNTLALRIYPIAQLTFTRFLDQVKEQTLKAFENQDYPFEDLVEEAAVQRNIGRNPLFDVMFTLQPMDMPPVESTGLKLTPWNYERNIAKFDMMLVVEEVEGELAIALEYCSKLFKRETIERFFGYFKQIVGTVTEKPALKIADIDILAESERNRLLLEWNNTRAAYPREKAIHELFEEQVERTPVHIAAADYGKGNSCGAVTYRVLNERANHLAKILKEWGIGRDTVVGLMAAPCARLMIGIMAILKAGGCYLPISPNIPIGRVEYILNDSLVPVLLADNDGAEKIAFKGKQLNLDQHAQSSGSPGNPGYHCRPGHLVYVIYTSGSTGRPKGVAVGHCQLVNFVYHMYNRYDGNVDSHDRCLGLTNIMFDVSVWEFFLPLVFGARLVILHEEKRVDAAALAQAIIEEGITLVYLPPGLLKPIHEELATERGRLSLNKMLVGVEPIRDEVLEGYMQLNPRMRIINGYGPTETTICATSLNYSSHPPRGEIVPIGTALSNNQVVLLDGGDHLVPIGTTGEISISGDGVSRGYLNNPELTAEKYTPHPYFKGKRMYRSGDLARLLPGGNIRFIGRRDQQLKIRGFRIELGEIENRLLKHEHVKQALVLAKEDERSAKYLCAYIVPANKSPLDTAALKKHLARDLPDYMIPSYFMQLARMPLTPNGKIDTKALPLPEIQVGENYAPPRDDIEKKLQQVWSQVLGIEKEKIGIDDDFFHLGGHSLKATLLAAQMQKEMDVKVALPEIFTTPHIRGLAAYIKEAAKEKYISIEPTEKREYYPLSPAQSRMYLLQQMDEQGIAYNIPSAWQLACSIVIRKLEQAFLELIRRHESLRTSFHMIAGKAVQRVHEDVEFEIEYYGPVISNQLSVVGEKPSKPHAPGTIPSEIPSPGGVPEGRGGLESAINIIDSFIRPFDLSRAPLLRVGLIEIEEEQHILMVDMHHIISDGTSMQVLMEEFTALWRGDTLQPPRLHYKDFSGWQNGSRQKEAIKEQQAYWVRQFAGEVPVLDLPTNHPRPLVQDFTGDSIPFEIDKQTRIALKSLARAHQTTLYMVLLSIYTVFLAKLSGQEDIVVGTPVAGRRHSDLGKMIGMFVNTLALRSFPGGEKSFTRFLKEVNECALAAFENQDYPFEELVEQVEVERDTGRNPLFDTVFNMQNVERPATEVAGLRLKPYKYEPNTAKFDLILQCIEKEDKLFFSFEYSVRLFTRAAIERFIRYFKKTLFSIIENPGSKLSTIEIITEKEKEEIMLQFNRPGVRYETEKPIQQLFEEQTVQTPDSIALLGHDEKCTVTNWMPIFITYKELDEECNRLVHLLVKKGVKAGTIVGIMVERSLGMVKGLLGILKAGGAYLPIDPESPDERIKYMLEDSGARILVVGQPQGLPLHPDTVGAGLAPALDVNIISIRELLDDCRGERSSPDSHTPAASQPPLSRYPRRPLKNNSEGGGVQWSGGVPEGRGGLAPATAPAYVIYTSGSTGMPKGVLISQRNICPLLHWGYHDFALSPHDRTIQNLSYFFDWSAWEIFITLTSGAGLFIPHPEVILDPGATIDFINTHVITVLHITPTHFQYLLHVQGDMNTLDYLFIGAEKLTHNVVLQGFAKVRDDCRVFNMYGPTEAAIISATLEIRRDDGIPYERLASVPIGIPSANADLLILDKYMNWCPINIAGELYIAGEGVAPGYLNRPELTAENFITAPALSPQPQPASGTPNIPSFHHSIIPGTNKDLKLITDNCKLYKTGDLCRWLPDGNVEFLGRIDQQVKIRGFRIELGEIENRLSRLDDVKEAVVIVKEDAKGDNYLCAYIVKNKRRSPETGVGAQDVVPLQDGISIGDLRNYLSQTLPEYMIPAYFIEVEKMPLNPNGKVDWKALPDPDLEKAGNDYRAPRSRVEEKLAAIWSELLALEKETIGIDANFFRLGGHSLKAALLTGKILQTFHVKLPLVEIFTAPTLSEMAVLIADAEPTDVPGLEPMEKREYYELSYNQRRLWFLHQVEPATSSYNLPGRIELDHKVDDTMIEKVLYRMAQRHESLRTGFRIAADQPVQYIKKITGIRIPFEIMDISSLPEDEKRSKREQVYVMERERPFDLDQVPLFRALLLRMADDCYDFIFNMHHIITDGWSLEVLKREFLHYYEGLKSGDFDEPEPLALQYRDFAAWHNRQMADPLVKDACRQFWEERFKDGVPELQLPVNTMADANDTNGAAYLCVIDNETTERLNELAQDSNTTLFTVLFSLFLVTLSRMARQKEVICSIISAGRDHVPFQDVVGFFVNSILFKWCLDEKAPFIDLLHELHKEILACFQNQDYPLELLFKELRMKYPDVPVSFNMLNISREDSAGRLQPGDFKPCHYENVQDVKFHMEIYATPYENGISLYWTYKKSLLTPNDIEYTAQEYMKLVAFFKDHFKMSYEKYRDQTKEKKRTFKRRQSQGI